MAFLRTLFWIAITVIVVVFSIRNWQAVTINLFGDMQADVKLPVLLLILVFLAGMLPALFAYHALRWRTRQRIAGLERALADLHAVNPPPLDPESEPAQPLLPEAAP